MVQLKASSLMEVIVSSVIMLIVFVLSMDLVTKLSAHKQDNTDEIRALHTMKRLINSHPTAQIITDEWGEIEVIKEDISEKLERVTLVATGKGKTWQLTKIIERQTD